MNKKVIAKSVIFVGVSALVAASIAQAKWGSGGESNRLQQATPRAAPERQHTPPEPKNLKVFKGVTHDQLIGEMRKMTTGLGVECSFCHHAPGFDSDTPRKEVARLMVRDYVLGMKHKDGSPVTCNDCHQGQANFLRTLPFEKAAGKWAQGRQVFKGMPEDRLMAVMEHFTKALGVKCDYCHTADFEDETPRKQIARYMMTEFSAKYVKTDGTPVTCDDCHQGHAKPLAVLPFPRHEERRPPSAAPAPDKKPGL
ncbi:MAG TPA: photosynthetic reaction center cytochrome c subunit family protein [Blastocatellia bacterium]|nr:photosynthetic reaction center cytochrome c subunit family protein [Blastocatellia bacterium]